MPALQPVNSAASASEGLAPPADFGSGEEWEHLPDRKGDSLVVRRIVISLMSFGVVLGLGVMQFHPSFGQESKGAAPAKSEPAQDKGKAEAAQPAPAKAGEPAKPQEKGKEEKKEAPQATEPPLPPIPKEVQEKIEAARKAVAEAIVAAQDAGLVETSIDPPPVLDILVTGRATDARTLKNTAAKKPYGLSPEVFAAWFTSYAAPGFEGIDYAKDIRIMNPSMGLKAYFDQRAAIFRNAIAEVRKAKGQTVTPAKAAEPKAEPKALEKKQEAPKPEAKPEPKKGTETKK
jgi:hypothetical protein